MVEAREFMCQLLAYEASMLYRVDNPSSIDNDVLYLTDDRGRTAADILRGLNRNDRRALNKLSNDISMAIRHATNTATEPPIDEGRLLRLLRARFITPLSYVQWNKPFTHAPHAFEKKAPWKALLHRTASAALCDAVRALWLERIVERFETYHFDSDEDLDVRALSAFGVDFGQPWGTMWTSLGVWLQSRVRCEDDMAQALRDALDEVTPPPSMDGVRAIMEETHPRLGNEAEVGRLPAEVLRSTVSRLHH
jgi:hypothetical protein